MKNVALVAGYNTI